MPESEGDGLRVLLHRAVDVHAGVDAGVLDAEAEGEVCVVVLEAGVGLRFEVGEESGFVAGGVGGVEGDEGVVSSGGGVLEVCDAEL